MPESSSPVSAVNLAAVYAITMRPATLDAANSPYWQIVRISHLSAAENRGRSYLFVDVVDEQGHRIPGSQVRVSWGGSNTVLKVGRDAPASTPLWKRQVCTVDVVGLPSERVEGIHSDHADEGPGNTRHHHSFSLIFRRVAPAQQPLPMQGNQAQATPAVVPALRDAEPVDAAVGASQPLDAATVAPLAAAAQKPLALYVLFGASSAAHVQTNLLLAADYLLNFHLTFGFSVKEAQSAQRVLVIGDSALVSDADVAMLTGNGAQVERIAGSPVQVSDELARRIAAGRP